MLKVTGTELRVVEDIDDEIPETHAMLESVFGSTFLAHAIKPPRSVLGYRLKMMDGEIIDFTSAVMIDGDKFIRLEGYDRGRHRHTSAEVRVANISWVREVMVDDLSKPNRKSNALLEAAEIIMPIIGWTVVILLIGYLISKLIKL